MDIYLWLTFYLEVSLCVQAIHSLLVKLRLTQPYTQDMCRERDVFTTQKIIFVSSEETTRLTFQTSRHNHHYSTIL